MKKVFLSYSRQDEGFVEELYRRLSRDGVSCSLDKVSIEWGANWVIELQKKLDECEIIVLVLSPAFFQSEWTQLEWTSIFAHDPGGHSKKKLLLLREPVELPFFLKPIQQIDVSSSEKFEKAYPKICRELGGTPLEANHSVDRNTLPPVSPLPERHYMPYRSLGQGFVGRVEALWQVHDMLCESQTAVVEGVGIVMGTGGLGKTQLAIEYVHRFGQRYPGGVFWIEADQGYSRLIQQLARYGGIEFDEDMQKQKEDVQLAWLWHALDRRGQATLIVLDNFPEQENLRPYLPPSGQIAALVTTRRRDLNYARLPLPILSIAEGVQLLNAGTRQFTENEAASLVEMLGGLPLALELTRHFLNLRPTLTIGALQQEIRYVGEMRALEQFARKYGDELPSRHVKEISATFQISWDLASPTAQQVLRVMAWLAPAPVPRRLLRQILELPAESPLADVLNETLSELAQILSLVELDQDKDPEMHRLIARFVREVSVEPEVFARTVQVVVTEMERVNEVEDIAALQELKKISAHAEGLSARPETAVEQKIELLNTLRWHHWKWGRYRQAETFGRQALILAQQSLREGDERIATLLSNLALALRDLGELKEAHKLLRATLQADEARFEPGHPTIALRQSNLATVLQDLGELEEARDLLRAALQSDEAHFAPGHPRIAVDQSNLALVLQDLGELEEARDLLRATLIIHEQHFEFGHPYIAQAQSNLAQVLRDLGELDEARDLLRAALQSDEAHFAPGHPRIAVDQSNLALVLRNLGELEEARDLLRSTLTIHEQHFEPGHPYIAKAQSNLALALQDLGELEEARGLLRAALQADEARFAPGHPTIAISQSNLAAVLRDLEELEEAQELAWQAYQNFLQKFGPQHPTTQIFKKNLEIIQQQLAERARE